MLLCGSFQNQVLCLINMLRFDEKQFSKAKQCLPKIPVELNSDSRVNLEDEENLKNASDEDYVDIAEVEDLVLLVQSDLGGFLLSRFNRATFSKTGLIALRQRTDATCPEQLTVMSLPMRPFLDLGVQHLVKYAYCSKSFSQSIAFGLA